MTNGKSNFIFTLFLGLVTFLALNLSICAQSVRIKQEEFASANRKAHEQLKGKPQRIIIKSISRFEHSSNFTETVNEIIPPGRIRVLTKFKVEPNLTFPEFTQEMIEISQKRFTRKNNEAWLETSIPPKSENKTQSEKHQTEQVIDYYFLGETKLEGQPADLYELVIRDKLKTKQPTGENAETLVVQKTKYWFGKNGLWIRNESEYEYFDAINNKITHRQQMIRIFEYDPNIKIEAPKIN